jgi:choline dehydrogenase-like flavoprotein
MIADLRNLKPSASLEADVCVIGAGAAGIVIARELASSRHSVILLESGGYKREENVQQLYCGDSIGEKYFQALHECRTRCFGGSTNCWGGICTPLNEIDFEERPWVPWSGWPVKFEELSPWMQRAHDICGTGPFLYDSRAWELIGIRPDFNPELFSSFVWQFNSRASTLNFGRRFRRDLRDASNVQVLLHANATELLTDESGRRVERVRVRTLEGQVTHVRARFFVLACGGIENARLLLASNSKCPDGLGNDRDLVGRFFQEHLQTACGVLVADGGVCAVQSQVAAYSHLSRLGGTFCQPGLSLAPAAQAAHRTLNASIAVEPFYDQQSAWVAFQRMRSDWKAGRLGRQTLGEMWTIASDIRKLWPEVWRRLAHGDRPQGDPGRFVVFARSEQAPNPNSRVTLSADVDQLGMRRASLDWRTTALDRKGIRLMARLAEAEFDRLNLGRLFQANWLAGEDWPVELVGGPHHMGTTRMSDDPAAGVVDRNCRVHGLSGLYIAGSSVFPTGGHANPTLSIIALATRLTAHLRGILETSSARFESGIAQGPLLASECDDKAKDTNCDLTAGAAASEPVTNPHLA